MGMPAATRLPGKNVFRMESVSSGDLSLDVREWGGEWLDFELIGEAGFRRDGWDHEWAAYSDGKPIQSMRHWSGKLMLSSTIIAL